MDEQVLALIGAMATEAGSRAVSKCYSMTGIWEDNTGRLSKTNPVTQVRVGGICGTLFKLLSKAI